MVFYTLSIGILAVPLSANAQTVGAPATIGYNGRLFDASGTALSGTYYFWFDIESALTGGTNLASNIQGFADADGDGVVDSGEEAVTVTNGFFTLEIPVGSDVADFANNVWFEMKVHTANSVGGAETLAPRVRVTKTPYSIFTQAIENSSADPSVAFTGRMYYDTDSNDLKWYNGTSWLGLSSNLDNAYNNFGATAAKITVDAAESQTGGFEIESSVADNVIIDLQSTGDFVIQDAGSTWAQFTDAQAFDVDGTGAISLDADAASNFSTSVGALTLSTSAGGTASSVILQSLDTSNDAIYLDADGATASGIYLDAYDVTTNTAGTIIMDAGSYMQINTYGAAGPGSAGLDVNVGSTGTVAISTVDGAISLNAGGSGAATLSAASGDVSLDTTTSSRSITIGDSDFDRTINVGEGTGADIMNFGTGADLFNFVSTETTNDVMDITFDSLTTANGIDYSIDGLTTGNAFLLSNSSTFSGDLWETSTSGAWTGNIWRYDDTGNAAWTGDIFHVETGTGNHSGDIFNIQLEGTTNNDGQVLVVNNNDESDQPGWLINTDASGAFTSSMVQFDSSTDSAWTGNIFDIDTGTGNHAGDIFNVNLEATTNNDGQVFVIANADESDTSGWLMDIDTSGAWTAPAIDADFGAGISTGNFLDITYATAAHTGNAIDLNMGTNVAGDAINIATASTSGQAIDIAGTGILTGDLVSISSAGATITDGVDALSLAFSTGDGTNPTNAIIHGVLTSGGTAGTDIGIGLLLDLASTAGGTDTAIDIENTASWDYDIDFQNDLTMSNATNNELTLTENALSLTFDYGQDASTIRLETASDLDLESTADGADAFTVTSTAGGIDISASGASAGEDIDITATGSSINLTSTEATADAIRMNASDAAGGIDVDAGTGGVDILTTGAFSIDGTGASNVSATSGNLTLSTATSGSLILDGIALVDINAGANLDIDVTGTYDMLATSTFSIDGTGASNVTTTSGNLTLSTLTSGDLIGSSVAGIDFDAGTTFDVLSAGAFSIDGTGASNVTAATGDLTLSATANSLVLSSGEATADAIRMNATNAAGGIDVDAGTGGIDIDTAGAAGNVTINTTSSGADTSGGITLSTDTSNAGGTGGAIAINALSTSGTSGTLTLSTADSAMTLNSGNTLDIDSGQALSINSTNVINIGNDNDPQAINIGTGGGRTITVGNATSTTNTAGDFNVGVVDGATMNVDGDGSPTATLFSLGSGDVSATPGAGGMAISLDHNNASGVSLEIDGGDGTWNSDGSDVNRMISLSDMTYDVSAGSSTYTGVHVGSMTEAGAGTATTSALYIGNGWDYDINVDGTLEIAIAGGMEILLTGTALQPAANDGSALGGTSNQWSDLFLANGGVINFNNGDITLTHSSNLVTLAGGGLTTTLGATDALTIDAATTDSTKTTGSLDMDVDVNNAPGGNVVGASINFELTAGGAGNVTETHKALQVAVFQNSANEANDDNLYAISVDPLIGVPRDGNEYGLYIQGTGWDQGIYLEDTMSINHGIQAPNTDLLSITNQTQEIAMDNVEGLVLDIDVGDNVTTNIFRISPQFTDNNADGNANDVWNVMAIDPFTATLSADGAGTFTNNLFGLNIGNLTKNIGGDEQIMATAVSIGTGWDFAVNVNNQAFSVSTAGHTQIDGILDIGTQEALGTDTTPSVATGSFFTQDAATVTAFDGDNMGQIWVIEHIGATVFDCDNTDGGNDELDCGAADITTAIGDTTMWMSEGKNATDKARLLSWMDESGVQTGVDLAEWFPATQDVESGDVLVASGTPVHVESSTSAYQKGLMGVVTTQPGLILGEEGESTFSALVALAGRVPVNVSDENGAIQIGDYLTSSATLPGYAMKATTAGPVIGMAMESFSAGTGQITVKVDNMWYSPISESTTLQGGTNTVVQVVSADSITASDAQFEGSVTIAEHLYGSHDMAGRIRMASEETQVRVTFETPYQFQPIVTFSSRSNSADAREAWISNEDETGFTLNRPSSTSGAQVEFNWIAVGVEDAQVTVSDLNDGWVSISVTSENGPSAPAPVVEEMPVVEETSRVEEPPVEEEGIVEEPPVVIDESVEETVVEEEVPVVDEAPVVEETSVTTDPIVDESL